MSEKNDNTETNWSDDLLGRKADSALLIKFLANRVAERKEQGLKGSYVLNLDAKYGQGKSFFMERFRQDIKQDYDVVYVNAWEDDHAEDPLIALMAAIEAAFASRGKKAADAAKSLAKKGVEVAAIVGKHAVTKFGERYLGDGIKEAVAALGIGAGAESEEIADKVLEEIVGKGADAALERFRTAKKTISAFKKQLTKLVESSGTRKPLFILIDELDRCRPTYAIALLERVKHLFDIDEVVFVIATDTSQLRHAVTAIYGSGFDGAGYLQRFFNRTYRFAEPEKEDYIRFLFATNKLGADRLSSPFKDNHTEFFAKIAKWFGLTLRDIEQSFDILRSVNTNWPWAGQLKIELLLLLPLIVTYVRGPMQKFEELSALKAEVLSKTNTPTISYRYRTLDGPQEDIISVGELLDEFINLARKPLTEIHLSGNERPPKAWMIYRFKEEFSVLHNSSWPTGAPPTSVYREYGELVRSLGRLTSDP